MPDKLTVEVYADPEAIDSDTPTTFQGIDFVSFISSSTYGIPALVAPNPKDGLDAKARATIGQKVLYVNTTLVPLFSIERTSE